MVTFHGTDRVSATGFVNGTNQIRVDISPARGFAEFGLGFYCQKSVQNAKMRAIMKYGISEACAVRLEIPDTHYDNLSKWILSERAAKRLRYRLRITDQGGTFTSLHDVIIGPIKSHPTIEQQKFQSQSTALLLNSDSINRTVV